MKIRKIFIMSFSILLILVAIKPSYAIEALNSKIIVKKEITLTKNPYLLDDKAMIPVRSFEESQDYNVFWNSSKQEVSISKDGKELYKISLYSNIAIVGGKEYKLNNIVECIDETTFIEVEFLNYIHNINIEINSNEVNKYVYKFVEGTFGFEPIFSDYSYNEAGNYDIYEMKSDYKQIPVLGNESMGLYIASHNRSDDVFMGYVKKMSGLTPKKEYTFDIQFLLATDVESNGFGIGGSPSSSVYSKSGVSTIRPESVLDKETNMYRMNIDIGIQSQDGKDMQVIGSIGKQDSSIIGFEYKPMQATATAISDENGCVYLIIGTDSGFEGFTKYYIDNVEISIN
jgi:hypothetical protein